MSNNREPITGIKKIFVKDTKWDGPQVRAWVWLIFIAAIITLFLGSLFSLADYTSHRACKAKAVQMNRTHKYGRYMGCLIQLDNGTYIPIENFKAVTRG